MKKLLHIFKPTYNKILWFYVPPIFFFLKCGTCTRKGNFGAFGENIVKDLKGLRSINKPQLVHDMTFGLVEV